MKQPSKVRETTSTVARVIYDSGEPLSNKDVMKLTGYSYHRAANGVRRLFEQGRIVQAGERAGRASNGRRIVSKLWKLTPAGEAWVQQLGPVEARPGNFRQARFRWACRPLVREGV